MVADLLDKIMNFFTDPKSPVINILYGWSGVCDQFWLCSFKFSFVTSSKLIVFV